MFYDRFAELCEAQGTVLSKAADEIGFDKSNVTQWKTKRLTPRADALDKIASYFDIPIDFLLERPPFDHWDAIRRDREWFVQLLQLPSATHSFYRMENINELTLSEYIRFVAHVTEWVQVNDEGKLTMVMPSQLIWEPGKARLNLPVKMDPMDQFREAVERMTAMPLTLERAEALYDSVSKILLLGRDIYGL